MQEIKREISKERYLELSEMSYSERTKQFSIPEVWQDGYGYYGHRLSHQNDKYYVIHKIGDSCD